MGDISHLLNKIHLGECLEFMRKLPDKCVDLVLTDPPYGIGADKGHKGAMSFNGSKPIERRSYKGGWDLERPNEEVFFEIIRVSKKQIIWGGNYFADLLPPMGKWLWWDKCQTMPTYGDGELAWTSLEGKVPKKFTYANNQLFADRVERLHPTQKPIPLFKWCLSQAKIEKGIVLDCFSGSGTTALACHDLGLDFICIEKDPDYHAASVKRLEEHQKQGKLF